MYVVHELDRSQSADDLLSARGGEIAQTARHVHALLPDVNEVTDRRDE